MGIWHQRANIVRPDGRAFISGERCAALELQTFEHRSPIDGRSLSQVSRCLASDVDVAVRSARRAFEDGRWSRQSPGARRQVLQRFAEGVLAAREELALLETLDMGKPIQYSLRLDVPAAAQSLAWFGECIDKHYGQIAPTSEHALALIQREPLGVVGAILPWNYPLVVACLKIAPALAMGNSVVLKPSERSSHSALRLAEIGLAAGLPPGVLNVLPGFGFEAGQALALHMDVDALAFTGTLRNGRRVHECAARSNLKRVFSQLGGKSALIVFADCADLHFAARSAATAMFFNQGASCNAPSRVLVHERIAAEFIRLLSAEVAHHTPGDPLDEDCVAGAIVDEQHFRQLQDYLQLGQAEGARLICGGRTLRHGSGGHYLEPAIFDHARSDMRIVREEVFGPMLTVQRFADEAEAIALANDSAYGLQAGIWTASLDRAHRVARRLRVGTVHVNQYDEDDIGVPFGGRGQSGSGRDNALPALETFSELKTTWIRIAG